MRTILIAGISITLSSQALAQDLTVLETHFRSSQLYTGKIVTVCISEQGCTTVDRTSDAFEAFDIYRNDIAAGNESDIALPATIIADTIAKSFSGSGTVKVGYKSKETKPDGTVKEIEVKVEIEGAVGKKQK